MCPCVVSFLPLLPLPPLTLSTDVAPATKWNVLQLIDCSPLRSTPHYRDFFTTMGSVDFPPFVVTTAVETACETSTLKVRALFPHLPATFTGTSSNFWASSLLADLPVFPSLVCGSCSSGQGFAYSFLQIPPHDGHPCCSAMYFVVAYAYSGLTPVRARPWRAN